MKCKIQENKLYEIMENGTLRYVRDASKSDVLDLLKTEFFKKREVIAEAKILSEKKSKKKVK